MPCPRDGSELTTERYRGFDVHRCHTCNGRWLDNNELEQLEETVTHGKDELAGTIEYSDRTSELDCPVCGKRMRAFNYRAYDLELDTCEDAHGFWLDAGEEGRVRDIMEERVRGLARAASAEEAWGKFVRNVGHKSVWDQVKNIFAGRR